MKQPSRFRDQSTPDPTRLHNFVALDNLNSQMPLIEVFPFEPYTRIWVAYDTERVCGTYLEVRYTGEVVCVTQYEWDKTERIVRPKDERRDIRLYKEPKQRTKNRRSKGAKKVHGRKKHASAKDQHRNGSVAAQKRNRVKPSKKVQDAVAKLAKKQGIRDINRRRQHKIAKK